MVNSVARTGKILNTNLGGTTSFSEGDTVIILAGEISRGLLLFDPAGTLGVISSLSDQSTFSVTTCALSVDINSILGESF